MKLENALFELTTLVDYGTYYLSKKTDFYALMKQRIDEYGYDAECDILDRIGAKKVGRWIYECYGIDDIYDNYTIAEYVRNNLDFNDIYDDDELLNNISNYTIKSYVKENYDANDIYSSDDMLDCMSVDDILGYLNEDDIKEWVTENCSVDDWACMSWQ